LLSFGSGIPSRKKATLISGFFIGALFFNVVKAPLI